MIWSRPELRVLFVCTANICRSPLAEGLLRYRLRELDLVERVQVRSAGTHAFQRNHRPDPRVVELAAEAGVSLAGIRARMITPTMVQSSDYVLVMERRQLEDVKQQCLDFKGSIFTRQPSIDEECFEKIQLLGNFVNNADGCSQDIADPYFGDLQGFYNVYKMIDLALTGLLCQLATHFEESSSER